MFLADFLLGKSVFELILSEMFLADFLPGKSEGKNE